MSKKTEAMAVLRQINETKAKIARLRESQANRPSRFVQLVESELENYELILAAKAITDKLQDMAEKAASIEVEEVMPILDGMKAAFGPEAAEAFNTAATESLRGLVEALKTAKDQIGNQIIRLEGGDVGEPMNDMGMGDELGGDVAPEMGADMMGGEMGDLGDAPDTDMVPDMDMELPDDGAGLDMELEDPVADDSAAGRARKESVESLDRAILESFQKTMVSGVKPGAAARAVAEKYDVDVSDVVDIVKEAAAGMKKKNAK
jgi:hypothetical protein